MNDAAMSKSLSLLIAGAMLAAGAATLTPVPAAAQSGSNAEIIVFGTDPCPRSTDDEIVVCKRYPESERFRLAPQQRPSGPRQVRESWAKRSQEWKTIGNTGIGSCSAVGPAGSDGCLVQEINRAVQEQKESSGQNSSPQL
jgi:hypothetical protein